MEIVPWKDFGPRNPKVPPVYLENEIEHNPFPFLLPIKDLFDSKLSLVVFENMRRRNFACFHAVEIIRKGLRNSSWAVFSFNTPLDSGEQTQSGQVMLCIESHPQGLPPGFTVIDLACYLYAIPYLFMPVAVATNFSFIEKAFSQIYTEQLNITTQLHLTKRG